jgi:hypothetical protein
MGTSLGGSRNPSPGVGRHGRLEASKLTDYCVRQIGLDIHGQIDLHKLCEQ